MSKRAPTEPLDRNLDEPVDKPELLVAATEDELKERKIYRIRRSEAQEVQPSKPVSGFVFKKADVQDSNGHTSEQKKAETEGEQKPAPEIKPASADQMHTGSFAFDSSKVNNNMFFANARAVNKPEDKNDSTAVNSQEDGLKKATVEEEKKEVVEEKPDQEAQEKKDDAEKTVQNVDEKKEEAKAPVAQTSGLFGNGGSMFGDNQKTSLFSGNPNPLTNNAQPSMFGGATSSLFGNVQSSIFGNPATGGTTTEQKPSIFANVGSNFFKSSKNEDDDEEGDGDGDDEPQEEEAPEDLTATTDPNVNTISIKNCKNFKIDDGEALGLGVVSIEQSKASESLYLLVFRNKAKRVMHSSMIVPKISRSIFMANRKTAMTVQTLGLKKDEEKGVIPRYNAKIGFDSEEDAADFKSEVEKIFNK